MSQNRQYELIYIVASDATEQQIADLHTQVEEIVGRYSARSTRPTTGDAASLPTRSARTRKATYVLEVITGSGELMKEIDRRLRVSDQVIRHLDGPRGRGEPRHRARAHACARKNPSAGAWPAACRRSGSPAKARSARTMTTIAFGGDADEAMEVPNHFGGVRFMRRRTRTTSIIIGDRKAAADAAATRRTTRSARCSGAARSASSARTRSTTSTTRTSSCWDRSCPSAARFCRAAFRAPARRTSASCRRPSSARGSWR